MKTIPSITLEECPSKSVALLNNLSPDHRPEGDWSRSAEEHPPPALAPLDDPRGALAEEAGGLLGSLELADERVPLPSFGLAAPDSQ